MLTLRLCYQPLEMRYQVRVTPSHPGRLILTGHTHTEKQGSGAGSSSHLGQPSRATLLKALQKTLSLSRPCPLWGCPQSKHPAEMEESHGKQDLCQEGQDHLGHLLQREDPSIASHAGGGRDKDKPI